MRNNISQETIFWPHRVTKFHFLLFLFLQICLKNKPIRWIPTEIKWRMILCNLPPWRQNKGFYLKSSSDNHHFKKYMTTLLRRLLNYFFLSTKQLDFTMYLKGFLNKCNWFLKNFKDMLLHGGRNSVTTTLKTLSEYWMSLNAGLHELLVHINSIVAIHQALGLLSINLNDYLTVRSWVNLGVGLWRLGLGFHDMSPIHK